MKSDQGAGQPNLPRTVSVILFTVITYCASFVLRTEFSVYSNSGLADWIILLIFASFPWLIIRPNGALKFVFLYIVTVLLEMAATLMILLFWYPEVL